MTKQGAAGPFALIFGAFLLVEGIWGWFSPVVFLLLTTNWLHASIHILLGLTGIATAMTRGARGWSMFVGVLLLAVGVLYFVPGISGFLVSLFALSQYVAILNIVMGVIAIVVAKLSPSGVRS